MSRARIAGYVIHQVINYIEKVLFVITSPDISILGSAVLQRSVHYMFQLIKNA